MAVEVVEISDLDDTPWGKAQREVVRCFEDSGAVKWEVGVRDDQGRGELGFWGLFTGDIKLYSFLKVTLEDFISQPTFPVDSIHSSGLKELSIGRIERLKSRAMALHEFITSRGPTEFGCQVFHGRDVVVRIHMSDYLRPIEKVKNGGEK
jgi:hypothetical protein